MDIFIANGISPDKWLLPPANHREPKDTNENKSKGIIISENHLVKNIVPKDKVSRRIKLKPNSSGIDPLKLLPPV